MTDTANLFALEETSDEADPEGYRASCASLHKLIGGEKLHANVFGLPPGQAVCPYHYEYPDEEWLIVLDGTPTLRQPSGERVLRAGDIVCFPAGPEGAHKVSNASDTPARVLILSSHQNPSLAVYPDSDKIGVWSGNDADKILVHRASAVEYYDGE